MLHILWSIIVGFVVGLVARWLMPGTYPMGFFLTSCLGIAGSLIGGLLARLFKKPEPGAAFHPAGFLLSVLGAILLLWLWRMIH
jgi:uncharacterized membrane protein YeaQ/YmgE (transglycosylase-associated protein family)